jgi:hypothetical protein
MQRWCEKEYLAYAATHEFTDAVAFTYYNKLARECRERADSLLKVLEALNGEVA